MIYKNSYIAKKPIITFCAITIFLLVIIIVVYTFFFTEIGDRFAKYHNYITVDLEIDEKQQNMQDITVNYIYDTGNIVEKKHFNNDNSVRFKEGIYGENIFEFVIPKEYFNKFNENVKISFGKFNTNWWHVCKYSVSVKVYEISEDKANITLSQDVLYRSDGGEKRTFTNEATKNVTLSDNSISIYE
ncbi:hypothetical protein RBH29_06845 [Herbivorax sp. ANBcel31]|uniref:hypothetical protein n=1 Tax=Herbivorax sp. ANBcel31 TaxID=3069754 RepID=UPI0027B371E3|nr:hypothetical protein [Herbivorax sp. ANBcel31]MDQ2086147.1 hypothetical protein [Herbivorax sp. ANBcel31]